MIKNYKSSTSILFNVSRLALKRLVLLFPLIACSCIAYGQIQDTTDLYLYNMSLEDLMNIEITSASKKSESLFDAPLGICINPRRDPERRRDFHYGSAATYSRCNCSRAIERQL